LGRLAKVLFTVEIALFCTVLMWFGAPALMIGVDQGSFPLLIGGVFSIIIQVADTLPDRFLVVLNND
jgi:hypothetical protein